MRHLVPLLLSASVYVGVRHFLHHQRVDKKLWVEAGIFALIASVVMYIYYNTYGYEYFDNNHGTPPPGYIKVNDPLNPEQMIFKGDPRGNSLLKSPPSK